MPRVYWAVRLPHAFVVTPNLAGGIAVALHPAWMKADMGGAGAMEEIGKSADRIVAGIDGFTAREWPL